MSATPEPYGKRLLRLCAEFEVLSWHLHPLYGDSLIAEFMGATRVLEGLDAAEQMLASIKAHRHA